MATNNFSKSDLFPLYNFIQASMIVYPKEAIITSLRDLFSKDSYYHYSKDQWGFANTVDHTDLVPGAGMSDNSTTRIFIGENYRYDGIYYPAILIKSGGGRSVPISINRERGSIKYDEIVFEDGYGNYSTIKRPSSFVTAGAWEGSIIVDVLTRSLRSRDDLVEQIVMHFTDASFESLHDVGIAIKPINYGGASETDDRSDKLFRQSITLDIRTEWRREIPVGNLIDTIFFTVDFSDLSEDSPVAANLTINSEITITDLLINL